MFFQIPKLILLIVSHFIIVSPLRLLLRYLFVRLSICSVPELLIIELLIIEADDLFESVIRLGCDAFLSYRPFSVYK